MTTRTCSKCQEDKPLTREFFYIRNNGPLGFNSMCKKCINLINEPWTTSRNPALREKAKLRRRAKVALLPKKRKPRRTKEEIAAYQKRWRRQNHEKLAADKHRWYEENKHRIKPIDRDAYNQKRRERWKTEPHIRIHSAISRGMKRSLKIKKDGKSWQVVLGYNLPQLMDHLEKQFYGPIKWENFGIVWEIDHILPVSRFKDEPIVAWKITNLRPLLKIENRRKSDKVLFLL